MKVEVHQKQAVGASDNSGCGDEKVVMSRVPLTMRDVFFRDPFFRNAWDDFEKIRRQMMKESEEFWQKVRQENKMLTEERMKSKDEDTFDCLFDGELTPFAFPRRWMLPKMAFEEDFSHFNERFNFNSNMDSNVIRLKDDEGKFELSLDTQGYRPDELKVNVAGNVLSVEAKHEEKGEGKFVSRQFSRKYTLPAGCEAHKVVSNLSSDGILMISAPKKQALKADNIGRAVPIEMK